MKKNSATLSDLIKLVQQARAQLPIYEEEYKKQEALTQDYLHKLELENLKRDERAKIAKQLSLVRRDRRYYKDKIEELTPIVEFFNDPNNKKCFNMMTQLLGTVRQEENYHAVRTYVPRVLRKELTDEKE